MYSSFFKPLLDFSGALFLGVLTFPLIIVLLIIVRLESKGNPLFLQKRLGLHGNEFFIYKIRTMKVAPPTEGKYWTSADDPRITVFGKFLRRTSLDELSQIWNVLKGDMSFIGPRPDVPSQKEQYKLKDLADRLSVKPGITGLAQCAARSAATFEQRLNLDLKYARSLSFRMDLKITFKTLEILINHKDTN